MVGERQFVECVLEDETALLIINNPPVNALSAEVKKGLEDIFDTLLSNSKIRVVILTGSGDKAFVAGGDIKQLQSLDYINALERVQAGKMIYSKIVNFPSPVICAINGLALGGGCELALCCDIRIASQRALFGLPEVSLGLIPGAGGTQRLPRTVSLGKAKEMIFTGGLISAEEAKEIGLVNRVVPHEELMTEVKKLAGKIIKNGPLAVQTAKKAINQGISTTLEQGLDIENEFFAQLCDSDDKNEGMNAFLEKRRPLFKGR